MWGPARAAATIPRMTDTATPAPTPSRAGGNAPVDATDWRIDPARALSQVVPTIPASALEIVDETSSTNTDLMQRMKALARNGATPGIHAVRAAYRQTAGRGRQGRSWHAQPGRALMFSLAYVLPRPLAGLAGMSLAVGLALVEALRALPGMAPRDSARIGLKWPNDVLLDDAKLAGILIETAWSTPDATAAVIGIGLNLHEDATLAAELAAARAQAPVTLARPTPPAALERVLPGTNLTDALAAVLAALVPALERFSIEGFAPLRARWDDCHVFAGREVVLIEQGNELARGTALGVDESGQLRIATENGVTSITTGDVSLRLGEPPLPERDAL
jgi:BirA family biotin operon repressor/biotin-[acetyl-CoA-carboxylase] ligase